MGSGYDKIIEGMCNAGDSLQEASRCIEQLASVFGGSVELSSFKIISFCPDLDPIFMDLLLPPDYRFHCPPFYFDSWDIGGILHMILKHAQKLYQSAPSPYPNLYRRLEKRPYRGNCNLRF